MSLPSSRKAGLRAGRQMQVEPCEIPSAGAPEILRNEAYSDVRRNDLPCLMYASSVPHVYGRQLCFRPISTIETSYLTGRGRGQRGTDGRLSSACQVTFLATVVFAFRSAPSSLRRDLCFSKRGYWSFRIWQQRSGSPNLYFS